MSKGYLTSFGDYLTFGVKPRGVTSMKLLDDYLTFGVKPRGSSNVAFGFWS